MADYANAANYPVDYFEKGYYCNSNKFYRPTDNSTMNNKAVDTSKISIGRQFGPVNTYYMYGTWLNRINPGNLFRHNWPTYYDTGITIGSSNYNSFKVEWPGTDF
jgi:hypothetical protein